MHTLTVSLGERSYPVYVGSDLLVDAGIVRRHLVQPRVALISNETVGPLYAETLAEPLRRAGVKVLAVTLPDGEAHKTWASLDRIFDAMLGARCDRGTTILALGGGVVGDLAGFAAATYMRGVPFVQIPTTLLAQVDSSVGGKTAINHPLGKNMIGAFYQPAAVVADMATLATLPERELRAGLAEVIKHGLLADAALFEWIERHADALLERDRNALAHVVRRSVEIKGAIVARDERETGDRALLNLGHTFGHAIEAGLGFGTWLHGEAIGAGLVMAADLSARLGRIPVSDVERVERVVARCGLPIRGPKLGSERYLELMSLDKKARAGKLRFVLLDRLGTACVAEDVDAARVVQTLEGTTA